MTDETPAAAGNRPLGGTIGQMPWRIPVNPDRPTEPLDPEAVQRLHRAAMRILSGIGIECLNPEAVAILKAAGCRVSGSNVRMDEAFVMEMLGHAPAHFTITPRNPAREIAIGGRHMVCFSVSSPPNAWDLERGRRQGDFATFRDFLRLTQSFNCIHGSGGYPVEPADIPAPVRHLDCLYEMLTLTDKVCYAYSLGPERIEDAMEMARIAAGLSPSEFEAKPRISTNINSVSPLKHDHLMLDGAMRMARRGQPVVVTPYALAGATAPVSMAGAVALSLAEALSALALLQYIRPGAPVALGSFIPHVDLRSGASAFGSPESMRGMQMAGQMARFYGLPLRASGACTSNMPDGQAMWESANSLWSAVQAGANMLWHAAGWLGGGQTASPEKFVMDCEMLQMIQRYFEESSFAASDEDIALEAIREVGPGGSFFGHSHSRARGASAFCAPLTADWRGYEAWAADGAVWTSERAHRIGRQILAEFEPPEMDHKARGELERFVARRKEEGGAPA
ncbi:trimethylamine methyltransferase family protein [Pseudogemmobacter humi]|uniref:Methyltransferase n=1 Tax=Pseudogemmobacter humi TaxID=2483812 RepID=A0A3P5XB00_9RHOB|nr:trimethylamine methyltransferase family protein [Pseudogemmobacter humi]VDC31724.1 Trimethylamine methyltransferase (MTTB) [Pseudogemmobacter humi]